MIQVGSIFKTKPAQRGLRPVPVCKEYTHYSDFRQALTDSGDAKLVQERTRSRLIGSIPSNTIFGPALEVKYVNIPSDNKIELEPGVAILVDSKLKESRPKFAGKDLPQHVWVNILKGTVQFAAYPGNPVLTARKIQSVQEKAQLGDAMGEPCATSRQGSTAGPRKR
jgi:hypothetical protein